MFVHKTTDFQWSLFISILTTNWFHLSDSFVKFDFHVDPFVLRACFSFTKFLTNSWSLFFQSKHAMNDDFVYSLLEDISMWHEVTFWLNQLIVAVILPLWWLCISIMGWNLPLRCCWKNAMGSGIWIEIQLDQSADKANINKYNVPY